LFRSPLPLAKKYIALVATDFASSALHSWGSGNDFKESIIQNLRFSAQSLGNKLKASKWKRFKKDKKYFITLNSAWKRKTLFLSKQKKKVKIVRSEKHFFS